VLTMYVGEYSCAQDAPGIRAFFCWRLICLGADPGETIDTDVSVDFLPSLSTQLSGCSPLS
jgi:hypothetical protein